MLTCHKSGCRGLLSQDLHRRWISVHKLDDGLQVKQPVYAEIDKNLIREACPETGRGARADVKGLMDRAHRIEQLRCLTCLRKVQTLDREHVIYRSRQ